MTLQATIHGIQHSLGPRLLTFMSDVPSSPSDCFYFKDQRISDSSAQCKQFTTAKDTFIDRLVENLNSRFPDNHCLSSFAIFDPQRLPSEAELATFGETELDVLCSHYGAAKVAERGVEIQPVMDERVVFKQFMSQNFRSCSLQTLSERMYQSEVAMCQYPNMYKLVTLALTMPVSTVDCERGNLIKTRIRARLQTKNVMKISIDTPDIMHMDD